MRPNEMVLQKQNDNFQTTRLTAQDASFRLTMLTRSTELAAYNETPFAG